MRIIGGKSKGLPLEAPRGAKVRPTSSKVREALFSILSDRIEGARMLDLFAGTGAVGIEALSRGAALVAFVENRPSSIKALEANLRRIDADGRARIYRKDIYRFLRHYVSNSDPFDLVYIDPPYHTPALKKLLPLLGQGDIISPSGIIIFEHFHKMALPDRIGPYDRYRSVRYGDTILSFYRMP